MEGDGGAPVAPEEVADLAEHFPTFKKYMTEEGIGVVEETGDPFDFEGDGEFATPLVPSHYCLFSF